MLAACICMASWAQYHRLSAEHIFTHKCEQLWTSANYQLYNIVMLVYECQIFFQLWNITAPVVAHACKLIGNLLVMSAQGLLNLDTTNFITMKQLAFHNLMCIERSVFMCHYIEACLLVCDFNMVKFQCCCERSSGQVARSCLFHEIMLVLYNLQNCFCTYA